MLIIMFMLPLHPLFLEAASLHLILLHTFYELIEISEFSGDTVVNVAQLWLSVYVLHQFVCIFPSDKTEEAHMHWTVCLVSCLQDWSHDRTTAAVVFVWFEDVGECDVLHLDLSPKMYFPIVQLLLWHRLLILWWIRSSQLRPNNHTYCKWGGALWPSHCYWPSWHLKQ